MRSRYRTAFVGVAILIMSLVPIGSASASQARPVTDQPAYLNPGLSVERRVADLLSRMTLQEKIGQMTQAERGVVADDPALIAQRGLG